MTSHTQVPYEALKRTTRDRKGVVEEFSAIIDALQRASDAAAQPRETQAEVLDDVDRRVGSLKRKVPALSAQCQLIKSDSIDFTAGSSQ